MKSIGNIGLKDVQAVYSGPEERIAGLRRPTILPRGTKRSGVKHPG